MFKMSKNFVIFLVLISLLVISGCGSTPIQTEASRVKMKIWLSPEYVPPNLARYPYIDVPLRGTAATEQRYAKNDTNNRDK